MPKTVIENESNATAEISQLKQEMAEMKQEITAMQQALQVQQQVNDQKLVEAKREAQYRATALAWINGQRIRERQLADHHQREIVKASNIAVKRIMAFLVPMLTFIALTILVIRADIPPETFGTSGFIGLVVMGVIAAVSSGAISSSVLACVNKFKTLPDIEKRQAEERKNLQESWGKQITDFARAEWQQTEDGTWAFVVADEEKYHKATVIIDTLFESNTSQAQVANLNQADPEQEDVRQGMNCLMHVWLGQQNPTPWKLKGLFNYEAGNYYFAELEALAGKRLSTRKSIAAHNALLQKMELFKNPIVVPYAKPNPQFVIDRIRHLFNPAEAIFSSQKLSRKLALCLAELLENPQRVALTEQQVGEMTRMIVKAVQEEGSKINVNLDGVINELRAINPHIATELNRRLAQQERGKAAPSPVFSAPAPSAPPSFSQQVSKVGEKTPLIAKEKEPQAPSEAGQSSNVALPRFFQPGAIQNWQRAISNDDGDIDLKSVNNNSPV